MEKAIVGPKEDPVELSSGDEAEVEKGNKESHIKREEVNVKGEGGNDDLRRMETGDAGFPWGDGGDSEVLYETTYEYNCNPGRPSLESGVGIVPMDHERTSRSKVALTFIGGTVAEYFNSESRKAHEPKTVRLRSATLYFRYHKLDLTRYANFSLRHRFIHLYQSFRCPKLRYVNTSIRLKRME